MTTKNTFYWSKSQRTSKKYTYPKPPNKIDDTFNISWNFDQRLSRGKQNTAWLMLGFSRYKLLKLLTDSPKTLYNKIFNITCKTRNWHTTVFLIIKMMYGTSKSNTSHQYMTEYGWYNTIQSSNYCRVSWFSFVSFEYAFAAKCTCNVSI